ncbi:hypothetical protein ACW23B_17585 [Streptomyces albidoflavus]
MGESGSQEIHAYPFDGDLLRLRLRPGHAVPLAHPATVPHALAGPDPVRQRLAVPVALEIQPTPSHPDLRPRLL